MLSSGRILWYPWASVIPGSVAGVCERHSGYSIAFRGLSESPVPIPPCPQARVLKYRGLMWSLCFPQEACQTILKRLEPFKKKNPSGSWEDWVSSGSPKRHGQMRGVSSRACILVLQEVALVNQSYKEKGGCPYDAAAQGHAGSLASRILRALWELESWLP